MVGTTHGAVHVFGGLQVIQDQDHITIMLKDGTNIITQCLLDSY